MERKFLHDISTPLAALQMNLESLAEDMKASGHDPESLKRIEKCIAIMGRVSDLLVARKDAVKKEPAA